MQSKSKNTSIFTLAIGILLSGCLRGTGAGYWLQYKEQDIKAKVIDRGLNGGHTAIYWETTGNAKFDVKEILNFAEKHKWILQDSMLLLKGETSKWLYNGKMVFPLSHDGFSRTIIHNSIFENFPLWIQDDLKVYAFQTNLLLYQPGTNETIAENGFVVLNMSNSQLSVYHLWGE